MIQDLSIAAEFPAQERTPQRHSREDGILFITLEQALICPTAFEHVKKPAALSAVMAGLDPRVFARGQAPAIQSHTEFIGFFMDGPVKPGHDNWVSGGRANYFTRSFAGTALRVEGK